MKFALILAVCFAAVAAFPVRQETDWDHIREIIGEFKTSVGEDLEFVIKTAQDDSPTEAGPAIAAKIEAAKEKALAVFAKVEADLAPGAETLTAAKAKEYLEELEGILGEVRAELQVDLEKLSPAARTAITNRFETAYANAKTFAAELYPQLPAGKLLQETDWDHIREIIGEFKASVGTDLQYVVDRANEDSPTDAGPAIAAKVEAAKQKALAVFEKVEADLVPGAETLTAAKAKEYLTELEGILREVRAEVQDDLDKLSPEARADITNRFETAYANAKTFAAELYPQLPAGRQ